jgi:hypothetical protein
LVLAVSQRAQDGVKDSVRPFAESRGTSLNKLACEMFTVAFAQQEAEARFHARASHGSPQRLLRLPDKLDRGSAKRQKS